MENGDSKRLAAVESDIRVQLQRERARFAGIKDIAKTMAALDKGQRGWLEPAEFERALAELGVTLDDQQLDVLYRRIGQGGTGGVECRPSRPSSSRRRAQPVDGAAHGRDRARLQARGFRVIEEVFARLGDDVAGQTILAQYQHYDFRGLGVVGIPEFVKASLRIGFTFTRAELRAIAEEFMARDNLDNEKGVPVTEFAVHYRRFISRATPTWRPVRGRARGSGRRRHRPGARGRGDEPPEEEAPAADAARGRAWRPGVLGRVLEENDHHKGGFVPRSAFSRPWRCASWA